MPPKSGCQKRKERAQKDAELKKLRGSFDRYLPNKNVTSSSVLIALESSVQENINEIVQTENTIGYLCNSNDSACPAEKVIDNSTILVKSTATSASEITALESSVQENINEIVQTENTIGHLCNSNDSACPGIIY
ncbi:hypothetical protein FWK35_00037013 [Aphis craccivora]|uniref:Uncharacterized protein n=1 Tax=Aphis craccivora TaxID=307492 RepID=A0A6G0VML4_APHCR|nr:hypothetical protein FWK35_00037013 [Aphis craccivora]